MVSLFRKEIEYFTFYDNDGKEYKRKTEIRFDPLTGESSRIVFDPGMNLTVPDFSKAAEATSGSNCPFCPENILKMTPLFPENMVQNGRVTYGEATVVPNLFPYSKYNGVTVMSNEHYVTLDNLDIPLIKDSLIASQKYINAVLSVDEEQLFPSIHWNYLPLSGGSIIHPHMHIIISEAKMNMQQLIDKKEKEYRAKHGVSYFATLYETEKKLGERWIGEHGNVSWVHAYAPKSHNDFIAIFKDSTRIEHVTEQDWEDFARGLQSIFATLLQQGFGSFNMTLNSTTDESPVYARIIPRLTIGGLDTSDINFFQALQQEPLTYKSPEAIAKLAREKFN